ncbi:MAG: transcription-repair coupling factor [Flavobacteriaceae bacterium]|nr:transcription-repair coupling factor [Flavobacteriaceae bacterium]MDG1794164.1 transcription-repair coupling factor [Flavobacteriaceae bacterium]
MSKTIISQAFQQSLIHQKLSIVTSNLKEKIHLKGALGSSLCFTIANIFKSSKLPFLLIFDNKEEAAYHLNDLEVLLDDNEVLFYPGSYRRPYQIEETDNANVLLRAEVLNRINSQKKPALIVTYPEALFEKVLSRKALEKSTFKVAVGETLNLDFFNEVLFDYQFKRVDFVIEPGEFSVRGGIVDVFSFSHDEPYRVEFFGDEIDSIRTFDVESQLSIKPIKKLHIIPNIEHKLLNETRQSFLEYITSNTVVFCRNIPAFLAATDTLQDKASEAYGVLSPDLNHSRPEDLFCTSSNFKSQLLNFSVVEFGSSAVLSPSKAHQFEVNVAPQPSFNKQFNLIIEDLNTHHKDGYQNYICCSNAQQAQRFYDIFETVEEDVHCQIIVLSLYQGFIDHDKKIVCYTDHQIFERYHKFHLKNGYSKKQSITLKELTKLEIGDYITHIDHGIGKFGGLQKIDVEGKKQEAIKLFYGERDILYLSIHALHKITKFNGKDGKPPKVYKLGSKAWKVLKQKTKSRVKEIAFNLIKLYAKRKLETGFRYNPDSTMQLELEASFVFEDTPDQITATAAIKSDMESDRPMDRLICGDVGFGKTEVALRAAFKAVDNGKQVAVLVPTTILAFQHAKTFKSRLKDFPVAVDYINRFKTTKQRKETLEHLESGKLDIIIGTHQLVNKSVKFKDLGLLIVDEEQKFGVAVKEKLKTLKDNVDVLTLTATPIPRTLQFSLMAARDLSVITTPPPNRFPIESVVIRLNEETIRDAIQYEIQRAGQVYFIHNRIENIKEVAGLLQRLVPDAKIRVGHGQMEGRKLEQLMLDFMSGEFDVLVSTTIVESGLDVPNANTIFINNANNFGLSDLHQMRGRVGRSNKKAFCYFITPDYHAMTDEARKRISALEQYTALGSGFNIAMKDLEIRGAGDLLGGEQSGFINDIGFETYQKILNEAIEELKETEFKSLYNEDINTKEFVKDVTIDTDFSLLFPDDYINNITERLSLYTQLNTLKNEADLQRFERDLVDRFGALPTQVVDLLDSVRIKWLATTLGFEKIVMKNQKLVGFFVSDQESRFYQSIHFSKVLQYVQAHPQTCTVKEKQMRVGLRLLMSFSNINSVQQGLQALKPILL